jgi:hypothetical protein
MAIDVNVIHALKKIIMSKDFHFNEHVDDKWNNQN